VIERMALTTGWIDWQDEDVYPRQRFVVVDIDGTLSDPSHRLHHIKLPPVVDPAVGWKPRWTSSMLKSTRTHPSPRLWS